MDKQFNYNNFPVRVITDQDETIWFAGIDICNVLGYADSYRKIKSLDEDEYRLDRITDGQGKQKDTLTVNEFGFYSLVLGSSKPEAKAFKKWVCHQVLPVIRKTGKFTSEQEALYDREIKLLAKKVFEIKHNIAVKNKELKVLKDSLRKKQHDLMLTINSDRRQLKIPFPNTDKIHEVHEQVNE